MRSGSSPTPGCCSPDADRRRSAARGARPARASTRGRRRRHVVRHRPGRHGRGVRARRPAVRGRTGQCGARASSPSTGPGVRSAARSDGDASASPTSAGDCLRIAELDGQQLGARRRGRPSVSVGSAPTSSPPRRWTASAGYWWSPDGQRIAACRVDNAPVQRWYIADPADPADPPSEHRATRPPGRPTPTSTLHVLALDGGGRRRRLGPRRVPLPRRASRGSTPERLLVTVQ